jgi:mRNA interferase YafQ
MFKLSASNKFKKDYKLCLKRGLNENLIDEVILLLEKDGKLPAKYKTHKLSGNYKGFLECHIQSDWLLIWEQNEEIRLISLHRTGTHSDLFK